MTEQVQKPAESSTQIAQASEPVRCQKGCGFWGNPRTNNLCSKCYKDSMKQDETKQQEQQKIGSSSNCGSASASPSMGGIKSPHDSPALVPLSSCSTPASASPTPSPSLTPSASMPCVSSSPLSKEKKSRCIVCKKKVGINFFKCKCDEEALFCSSHRFPHSHSCTFDHKKTHQSNLSKQNPEIKKLKLEKI